MKLLVLTQLALGVQAAQAVLMLGPAGDWLACADVSDANPASAHVDDTNQPTLFGEQVVRQ